MLFRSTQQSLIDDELIGFGCRGEAQTVRNKVVTVEADVVLRDWGFTHDTIEIDEAVRPAVRSYFDDRQDWSVWKRKGLRSAISQAHDKILHCSEVVVRDTTGAVLSEISSVDFTVEQFHYYLAGNGVTCTYSGPG